jgi:hypothetical protein
MKQDLIQQLYAMGILNQGVKDNVIRPERILKKPAVKLNTVKYRMGKR